MKMLYLYLTTWNLLGVQDLWASSLSNPVDNLTEGIHKVKCKDCGWFIEYENVKENSVK